jgi:hypothetical protein
MELGFLGSPDLDFNKPSTFESVENSTPLSSESGLQGLRFGFQ